jgi:hypothetical protein
MMLFWNIRYLDRADKQFKNRRLYLHTKTLDSVTRAAVELVVEGRSSNTEMDILKYRHLFIENNSDSAPGDPNSWGSGRTVGPSEYFEDEAGKEITDHEIARILTGSPTARLIPAGAKQHEIDFMLSESKPIPIAEVSLTPEELRLLGYFVRDLQELRGSAFMKDGPGKIKSSGAKMMSPNGNPTLETAVTDEEIRSFVMIFRRLYMTGDHDPASFVKIIPIFTKALGDNPYSKLVAGIAKEYQNHLDSIPDFRPFIQPGTCTFTTKRLIDVFLYTQYAHQPSEKRQRQFNDYLGEVYDKGELLTWMFLTEIWQCSLEIGNAGKIISWWFKRYCDHHQNPPDLLNSLRDNHSGLGAGEKEEDRQARLFREKTEELAMELWKQNGCPASGPSQFLNTAAQELRRKLQQ